MARVLVIFKRFITFRNVSLVCFIIIAYKAARWFNYCRVLFAHDEQRWSKESANDWYRKQGWIIGTNFIPSSASNQLEMWQRDSFDSDTIDTELEWMQDYGMNTVRVFLHHLLWQENPVEFLARLDHFLDLAETHRIRAIVVFFDDVWAPEAELGDQPEPIPHLHNSRWLQSPGLKALRDYDYQENYLKPYFQEILRRYANDDRILFWDLYNEPGNRNTVSYGDPSWKPAESAKFLEKLFSWAREVNPSQPLSSAVWSLGFNWEVISVQLRHSDVITFHLYSPLTLFKLIYTLLSFLDRPIICTEYMARSVGSTFQAILPYARSNCIGAINWGWVSGRTQTIYPWSSWVLPFTAPPRIWFHDVVHPNGSAFDKEEEKLIKALVSRGCENESNLDGEMRPERSVLWLYGLVGLAYAGTPDIHPVSACAPTTDTVYGHTVETLDGKNVTLEEYRVYTNATFADFNTLLSKYNEQGLQILGFPSNQFGHQEPAKNHEILNCYKYVRPGNGFELKKGGKIFGKIDINGSKAHPLFKFLRNLCMRPDTEIGNRASHFYDVFYTNDVAWNFEKFLIDKEGRPRYRFTYYSNLAHMEDYLKTVI